MKQLLHEGDEATLYNLSTNPTLFSLGDSWKYLYSEKSVFKVGLALNPATPEELLSEIHEEKPLRGSSETGYYMHFLPDRYDLSNPFFTKSHDSLLEEYGLPTFKDFSPLLTNFLRLPRPLQEYLSSFSTNTDSDIRELFERVKSSLSDFGDFHYILRYLAMNPNASEETLSDLFRFSAKFSDRWYSTIDHSIQLGLVLNPTTPYSLLSEIYPLRDDVLKVLISEHPNYSMDKYIDEFMEEE